MATLPGGAADKLGNRYEGRWTVLQMLRVLDGQADSITLEPIGPDGRGVEFWIAEGPTRTYHQVKRQESKYGNWSLAQLKANGVLGTFARKLEDQTSKCLFVSTEHSIDLHTFAERSQISPSLDFFKSELLTRERQPQWSTLVAYWSVLEEVAFDRVKRVSTRTVDDVTLGETIDATVQTLFDCNSSDLRLQLAEFALDNLHRELRAHDILQHLHHLGYRLRDWRGNPRLLESVRRTNELISTQAQADAIGGQLIERSESSTAWELLNQEHGSQILILAGKAGSGKSSIVPSLMAKAQAEGWPTLALRLDRYLPVHSPEELGRKLELGSSPVSVLSGIAQKADCLLIIDQLDAISQVSGRHSECFDVVHQMLASARAHPKLRVVIVCREFDLHYDGRLRRLAEGVQKAKTVTVGDFSIEEVKKVLGTLGVTHPMSVAQLQLLQLPLHLRLLEESHRDIVSVVDFANAIHLFRAYWESKEKAVDRRLGRQSRWEEVCETLCESMSSTESLTAPDDIVPLEDSRAMTSEHVLILERYRLAFFHELFFDYVFARQFCKTNSSLLDFLLKVEQGLFRRAQVRQILAYMRVTRPSEYESTVESLLRSASIRFHIKALVLAFLGQQPDPQPEEWRILKASVNSENEAFSTHARRALFGSVSWATFLIRNGEIDRWLSSDESLVIDRAIYVLAGVDKAAPELVAEALEPCVEKAADPVWKGRLVRILRLANLGSSKRLFDVFTALARTGALLEDAGAAGGGMLWYQLSEIAETRPEWMCEVLSAHLESTIDAFQSHEMVDDDEDDNWRRHRWGDHDAYGEKVVKAAVVGAPIEFVRSMLPQVRKMVSLGADRGEEHPRRDAFWPWRHKGGRYGFGEVFLEGMVSALASMAMERPEELRDDLVEMGSSGFETLEYLTARVYAACGAIYAELAVDFICESKHHLSIDYSDSPHRVTREVLACITPHCSDEGISRLEQQVLGYCPQWERSADSRRWRGHAELALLRGFSSERRSRSVTKRIQELERKLGKADDEPGLGVRSGLVQSPVPDRAAAHMSDQQWISAILHYPSERRTRVDSRPFIGGGYQLAQLAAARAKVEPKRFARLLQRLPHNTPTYYFSLILYSIGDSGDQEAIVAACLRCHDLPDRVLGVEICRATRQITESDYVQSVLPLVLHYALNGDAPSQDSLFSEEEEYTRSGRHEGFDELIINRGFTSSRAAAADAIAHFLFADLIRIDEVLAALKGFVLDESTVVRVHAGECLLAALNHNRELAVSLFQELVDMDDWVLATRYTERFLIYAVKTHFDTLKPVLQRMINSSVEATQQCGARISALASMEFEEAGELVAQCLAGPEPTRVGIAQVMAANLTQASLRSQCVATLIKLFDDPSRRVRDDASDCLRRLLRVSLNNYMDLIAAYVKSHAFLDHHHMFLRVLEDGCDVLPEIACEAIERVLRETSGDTVERIGDAEQLNRIALRVYRQSFDQDLRTQALDLIDKVIALGIPGDNRDLVLLER